MKYAGGFTLGPVVAAWDSPALFEVRFSGDLVDLAGYGKGVDTFGGSVYAARYRRSEVGGQ